MYRLSVCISETTDTAGGRALNPWPPSFLSVNAPISPTFPPRILHLPLPDCPSLGTALPYRVHGSNDAGHGWLRNGSSLQALGGCASAAPVPAGVRCLSAQLRTGPRDGQQARLHKRVDIRNICKTMMWRVFYCCQDLVSPCDENIRLFLVPELRTTWMQLSSSTGDNKNMPFCMNIHMYF